MKHYLVDVPRGTVFHLINNYFEHAPNLDLHCHLRANEPEACDLAITERLLLAFTKANAFEQQLPDRPNQGVWEMVKNAFHGEAYRLLFDLDVQGLAEYLCNALRTQVCYGLGTGPAVFSAFQSGGEGREANVLLIKDRLVSLAIALGVLPEENPELGRYGQNILMPLTELVGLVENHIGVEMHRPPIMGMFGLLVGENRIIDPRVPDDVYGAERLKSISVSGAIAEIGGGFGGTAYQCVRVGLRPTIYDLPIIGVIQGFFLIKALGDENVRLYAEKQEDRLVNVLPWWEFYNTSRSFDTVFNRDSMAEFQLSAAINYLAEIKRRGVKYLSINQEAEAESGQPGIYQLSVGRLAKSRGMQHHYRFPYWIRRGWVEELFS
jgi:hypothetical protein